MRTLLIAIAAFGLATFNIPVAVAQDATTVAAQTIDSLATPTITHLQSDPVQMQEMDGPTTAFTYQQDVEGSEAEFSNGVQRFHTIYGDVAPYDTQTVGSDLLAAMQSAGITDTYTWVSGDLGLTIDPQDAVSVFSASLTSADALMHSAQRVSVSESGTATTYHFTRTQLVNGPKRAVKVKVKGKTRVQFRATKVNAMATLDVTTESGTITALSQSADPRLAGTYPSRSLTISDMLDLVQPPTSDVLDLNAMSVDPRIVRAQMQASMVSYAAQVFEQATVYTAADGHAFGGADLSRALLASPSTFTNTTVVGSALQIIAGVDAANPMTLCTSRDQSGNLINDWNPCPVSGK